MSAPADIRPSPYDRIRFAAFTEFARALARLESDIQPALVERGWLVGQWPEVMRFGPSGMERIHYRAALRLEWERARVAAGESSWEQAVGNYETLRALLSAEGKKV